MNAMPPMCHGRMGRRWARPARKSHFDRVEWHTIPEEHRSRRLQSGEVDWWEQPTSDLLPLLRKQTDVTVDVIDTLGYYAVLRFNHLHPPFNNADIRRALSALSVRLT